MVRGHYTKYCIECHMVFYVIDVTFLVTIATNKFTNIVILMYFQFIQMSIIETNLGIICILTNLWRNIVMNY
jgi:hypothetical protein